MVILGFLLLALATLVVIGALFTIDGADVELYGIEMAPLALFFVGAATVAVIGLGAMLISSGTRRGLRHRRERKRLTELSDKLDRVDEDRRREDGTTV